MDIKEISALKRISHLSILRSIILASIGLILIVLDRDPIDDESNIYLILFLSIIYAVLTQQHLWAQLHLWKNIVKYRFLSWYYISFSVIGIIVLIGLAIAGYPIFHSINLSLLSGILAIIEIIRFYIIYIRSLHFIAIRPQEIIVAKKKLYVILPQNIQSIHYRNDILIFQLLPHEQTVFVNFLEVQKADEVRPLIAQWLKANQLPYPDIIEALQHTRNS